jgi:uncharacterized membrane protein
MENNTEHGEPMQGKTCNGCRCGHHKVIPILIILVGLEFLLAQVNVLTWGFVDVTWPILVIIVGCMKLFKGSCKCCGKK